MFPDIWNLRELTVVNDKLFFIARDSAHGFELYVKTGSDSAPHVLDVVPGAASSSPRNLTVVGDLLYFTAYDNTHGRELWRTDGTIQNTELVDNIFPFDNGSDPENLTVAEDKLFFVAEYNSYRYALYVVDGPNSTPRSLTNYGQLQKPYEFEVMGNQLFFCSPSDGTLWKTDGSAPILVDNSFSGSLNAYRELTAAGGRLYFLGRPGLWTSDGTSAGTGMVWDESETVGSMTAVNDRLFFATAESQQGQKLWVSDGTSSGTILVKDLNEGVRHEWLREMTAVGNLLYFTATDETGNAAAPGTLGRELWRSDGTEAGTVLVQDIYQGVNSSGIPYNSEPKNLFDANGVLYFTADDGIHGRELWRHETVQSPALTVDSFTPADDATGVALNANLVIEFSENVQEGTGNIVIRELSDNSEFETIDVTSAQVTVSGKQAIIDPSPDFEGQTVYYVQIDSGAFEDPSGNRFAGIADSATWDFTTASDDTTAPIVTLDEFSTDFNVPTLKNTTAFSVSGSASDPESVVASNAYEYQTSFRNGTVWDGWRSWGTGPSSKTIGSFTDGLYRIRLAATNVAGLVGYSNVGYFRVDTAGPTISGLSPPDNGSGVGLAADLSITFGESIDKGSGKIYIKKSSDGGEFEQVSVTDSRVTISGSTATIDPSANLAGDTDYYVEIDSGAFKDSAGNEFAGISGSSIWNFTTAVVDTSAPIVTLDEFSTDFNAPTLKNTTAFSVSGSASDPESSVASNAYEYQTSFRNGTVWDDWRSWGTGPSSKTIGPFTDGLYKIRLAATNGAGLVGYSNVGYFRVDTAGPTITGLSPPDDGSGVGLTADLLITFGESIQKGSGKIYIKKSSDGGEFEQVSVTDSRVTVSGSTATIDPSANLAGDTGYYVEVDSGAFKDLSGNDWSGITDATTWNFTTEDDSGTAKDFGDAPPPYPVTLAVDGARHVATGPRLGATRDNEADGQPSASAIGDGTDEDGVTFGTIRVGQLDASLTVNVQNAPSGAMLDAWFDFNGDGNWGGPFERIAHSERLTSGDNVISFDVPSWTVAGNTYARFRLSSAGGLGVTGAAADGEVEDYQVGIADPAFASGTFSGERVIDANAEFAFSVFAADVNDDGHMDVLSASVNDDTIAWYQNNGSQQFTERIISATADGAASVFATDIDGDGDMDVLSASLLDDTVSWYENNGSEQFTEHEISTTADGAISVSAADMDGDGDLDVLSAAHFGDTIAWYENDGSQQFTQHTISATADAAKSEKAEELNDEGHIEV